MNNREDILYGQELTDLTLARAVKTYRDRGWYRLHAVTLRASRRVDSSRVEVGSYSMKGSMR